MNAKTSTASAGGTEELQGLIKELSSYYESDYPEYFGAKKGSANLRKIDGDGKIKTMPGIGCHNATLGFFFGSNRGVFSSLWCRYPDLYEAAVDYWDYLTDTKSGPFAKYLKADDIVILRDKIGRPLAVGTFNTSTVSAQVLTNIMIGARVPQEMSNKIRSYWLWRRNGFTRPESILLAEYISVHVNGSLSLSGETYTHLFDRLESGISLRRLEESDPDIQANPAPYTKSGSYGPVGSKWHGTNISSYFSKNLTGKPSYSGLFPDVLSLNVKDFNTTAGSCVSSSEAVSFLLKNRSEWRALAWQ
jgi:hypothetical protein